MQRMMTLVMVVVGMLLLASAVMAEPPAAEVAAVPAAAAPAAAAGSGSSDAAFYLAISVLTAGFGVAIGTIGAALGQGNAVARAVEGIARQPEAAKNIQTVMIIGLAFIESLTIYALLVSVILIFVNPWADKFLTLIR